MTGFNVRVNHHVSPTQSAPIEVTDLWQKSFQPDLKEGAAQKIKRRSRSKDHTLVAFTAITG